MYKNKEEEALKGMWEVFRKRMQLDSFTMKKELAGYNPSEIHCIAFIGEDARSNVTKLAEAFDMTRGAVSKLTKKLIMKNLIKSYKKSDNNKEVFFTLTDAGNEIYHIHKKIHAEFKNRDKAFFESIPAKQYDDLIDFAKKYNEHLDAEINKLGATERPYNK